MSDKKPDVRDFVKNAFAATTEKAAGPPMGAYGLSGQSHTGAPQISGAGRAGVLPSLGRGFVAGPGFASGINPGLAKLTGNRNFGPGPGTPSVAAVGGSATGAPPARPDLANYGAMINAKNHPASPGAAPVTLPKPGSAEAWGASPKPPLNMGVYSTTPSHTSPSMAAKPATPAGAMPSVPATPPIPPVPKPATPVIAAPAAAAAGVGGAAAAANIGPGGVNQFGKPWRAGGEAMTHRSAPPVPPGIAGVSPPSAPVKGMPLPAVDRRMSDLNARLTTGLISPRDAMNELRTGTADNPPLLNQYGQAHPETAGIINNQIQSVADLTPESLNRLQTAAVIPPRTDLRPGEPGYPAMPPTAGGATDKPAPPIGVGNAAVSHGGLPPEPPHPDEAMLNAMGDESAPNDAHPDDAMLGELSRNWGPLDYSAEAARQNAAIREKSFNPNTIVDPHGGLRPFGQIPATPPERYPPTQPSSRASMLAGQPDHDGAWFAAEAARRQAAGEAVPQFSEPPPVAQPNYVNPQQGVYARQVYQPQRYQQQQQQPRGFHPFRAMFGKRGSQASPTGLLGYFGKSALEVGEPPVPTAAPRKMLDPSPPFRAVGNAIFNRDPNITPSPPQREPAIAPPVVAEAPAIKPTSPSALKPGEPGYPAMPPPTMPGPPIGTGNPPLSHGGVRPLSEPIPGHPVDPHGGLPQSAAQPQQPPAAPQPAGQPQPAQAPPPPTTPEAMDAKLQGIRADVEAGKPLEVAHRDFAELAQQYKTTFPEQKQLAAKAMSDGQLDTDEINALLTHTKAGAELGEKAKAQGLDIGGFIQKTWAAASPEQKVMLVSGLSLGLISVGSMLFGGPGGGNIAGLLGSLGLLAGGAGLFNGLLGGARPQGGAPPQTTPPPGPPSGVSAAVPVAGAAGQAASAYAREGGQQKQPAAGEPPGQPSGVAGGGAAAPPANTVNAPRIQAAFNSPRGLAGVDDAAMPALLSEWSRLGQPQRLQLVRQLKAQNPEQFNGLLGKLQFAATSTPNSWLVSAEQRRMAQQLLPTVNAAVGS